MLLFSHEKSDTPFATALISRSRVYRQDDSRVSTDFEDYADLSVSRRGSANPLEDEKKLSNLASRKRASAPPDRSPTIVNGHEIRVKIPAEETFSSTPEPLHPFGRQTPDPSRNTPDTTESTPPSVSATQFRPSQLYHLPTRFSGRRRTSRGSIVISDPPLPVIARAFKRASHRLSRSVDTTGESQTPSFPAEPDDNASTFSESEAQVETARVIQARHTVIVHMPKEPGPSRTARRVQKERQRTARSMSVNFSRPIRRSTVGSVAAIPVRSKSETRRPTRRDTGEVL